MNKEYHYLLMSQQDLLQNEVVEEILRERTSSYLSQNRNNDFWILTSPQFILNKDIKEIIKKTNFYKQKQNLFLNSKNNHEFYCVVLSLNKEFITWLSLRLGYFENIETFDKLKLVKKDYISNGILGKIEKTENNFNISPLKANQKFLSPDLLTKKYKKLVELSYRLID
jgi:hypothetical protein